ncbi:MAG: isocitrate dehydrogenase kinase/phosphatase AceK regulatory subunit [Dokdonella sp.]
MTAAIQQRAAALISTPFSTTTRFSDITRRAKRRFERRDWSYVRVDAARIDLYDVCVRETLGRLELLLEERVRSRQVWSATRDELQITVRPLLDREFQKPSTTPCRAASSIPMAWPQTSSSWRSTASRRRA